MSWLGFLCILLFVFSGLGRPSVASADPPLTPDQVTFFESKIRPLLVKHCYKCHSSQSKKPKANLRLDHQTGWATGGDSGPVIVPGDPAKSLLIKAIGYRDDDLRMPPKYKLPKAAREALVAWVKMGAPDPRTGLQTVRRATQKIDYAKAREHWAYRAVTDPMPPKTKNTTWSAGPIDHFILTRLEAHSLQPSPPADLHTLIRRVTFDLIGLPPTPEEIESFVNDQRPDAWVRVVDRLLASQHYGERWGRYWLDLARYADSNGADENKSYGLAWRYRDYVIRSFNADKPYDRFIREQLAGDLLPKGKTVQERNDNLIATGFLLLGPKMLAEQDKDKLVIDVVDEQLQTFSKTFLAQTIGCARCHNHKFDPITTQDYYGLAGIFKSTRSFEHLKFVSNWNERSLDPKTPEYLVKQLAWAKELGDAEARRKQVRAEFAKLKDKKDAQAKKLEADRKKLDKQITEIKKRKPNPLKAMAVSEGKPVDLPVHIRGSHRNLAKQKVARRTPVLFENTAGSAAINPKHSGRMALARWLTDPKHPLTARVMVNRIWQGHFGVGLVRSTSYFGTRSEPPSHPLLLDWLAKRFMEDGWSIKKLHRRIALSKAYRMSSNHNTAAAKNDVANRLLWRQDRRRLEVEPIRDALLAVSGRLDRTMGGSLLISKNNAYSREPDKYDQMMRRAVYLPVVRVNGYDMFSIFDYTDNSVSTNRRQTTTVAPQALFMLNSPLVSDSARTLAKATLEAGGTDAQRVGRLYLRVLARPAKTIEVERAVGYVQQNKQLADAGAEAELDAWADLCQALLGCNEFVYLR